MPINNNAGEFDELARKYRAFKRSLPNKVAITAANFFKKNFRLGGFNGKPFKKWKKPANPRKTGSTLVGAGSGRLRRNIKKLRANFRMVVVGVPANIQYARIHNEGGKIPITPKMRRYFWAMHKKTGNDYYKGLALTKKTHFDMPERKFIGDSPVLAKELEELIIGELKKAMT